MLSAAKASKYDVIIANSDAFAALSMTKSIDESTFIKNAL
jgi:hypothetical protein